MAFSKTSTFDGEFNSREKARIERKSRKEAVADAVKVFVSKATTDLYTVNLKPNRGDLETALELAQPFPFWIDVPDPNSFGKKSVKIEVEEGGIAWEQEKARVLEARFPDTSKEKTQAAFDEVTRRKEEYVDPRGGLAKSRWVGKFEPITLFGGSE